MFVYFIGSKNDGPIKIGKSKNVEARLIGIQTGYPYELSILHVVPSSEYAERDLHRRFRRARLHGEWFERRPVLNFILKIQSEAREAWFMKECPELYDPEKPIYNFQKKTKKESTKVKGDQNEN